MASAKRHDHQQAIDDYTAAIDMPETPADMRAMVLYNRALVHVATGEDESGTGDLNTVLTMDAAPINVKTMARHKLARMESRAQNSSA